MASIFDKEPVYITLTEARESSWILDPISESTLKELIYKSELIIDAFIIRYGEKFNSSQEFIFPIKWDNSESLIPNDIKIACLKISEYLSTGSNVKNWVERIDEGDTSITFNPNIISPEVQSIISTLRKYKRNSFKIIP